MYNEQCHNSTGSISATLYATHIGTHCSAEPGPGRLLISSRNFNHFNVRFEAGKRDCPAQIGTVGTYVDLVAVVRCERYSVHCMLYSSHVLLLLRKSRKNHFSAAVNQLIRDLRKWCLSARREPYDSRLISRKQWCSINLAATAQLMICAEA